MGKAASALRSQRIMLERARRFVEKAARVINVVEAYIVGSRARGDYLDTSDIDVVIVVEGVEGMSMKERVMMLADLAEPGVEYLIYSRNEWVEERSPWIKELKKEAVKIYPP